MGDEGGAIQVFSYSGFVLTTNAEFTTETVSRGQSTLTVPGPIRLAQPTWRPIPQFTLETFKRCFPGAPADGFVLRVAILPYLTPENEPTLLAVMGDGEQDLGNLPRDTFVVKVSGPSPQDGYVAADVLEDVFAWLRVMTGQWWIGRASEPLTGNLHLVIPLRAGDIGEQPFATGKQTTPSRGTRRLEPAMWRRTFELVREGKRPYWADTMRLEVIYLLITEQWLSALIVLCSFVELKRDEILAQRGVSKSQMGVAPHDLLKHMSIGFESVLRRNLKKESPETFDFLKKCWIARGHLAHGKGMTWGGMRSPPNPLEIVEAFDKLVEWLDDVLKSGK